VSRRTIGIELAPLVEAFAGHDQGDDEVTVAILDATESLLSELGLRRWSVDDVADRAGVGRTSVYRKFPSRDDLVYAVLARELRSTLAAVREAAAACRTVDEQVAAAAAACLSRLRVSVVERLLQSDPETLLPFLTLRAGPLVAIARTTLAGYLRSADPTMPARHADEVAETAARLGLSFILTRETTFALDDPVALRQSLRRLVGGALLS